MLLRSMPSAILKFFALAFSALLPVVNPLGSALIFLGLVGPAPDTVYRDLARQIAIRTIIFFLVIELVGTALLSFFGISLPVVQVAGGLVLAAMGWGLLNQRDAPPPPQAVIASSDGALAEKDFYPLSAHASIKSLEENAISHAAILMGVIAISILVFFCYAYAPKITSRISPQTANGILRFIAFVLLCIGVQICSNGIRSLIRVALQ